MFFARSLHIPKDQLRIIATLNEQVTVLSGESQASPWRMSKNPTTLDPSLDPFFIPQTLGDLRENWSHWTSHLFNPIIIELDDGKFYRKALYLMVKTMVSCRFSLKPIQWHYPYSHPIENPMDIPIEIPIFSTTPRPPWAPSHSSPMRHGKATAVAQGFSVPDLAQKTSCLRWLLWEFQGHGYD